MVKLKCNKHSVGQNSFHFVWRPKYNVSVFYRKIERDYMVRVLMLVSEKWGIKIYEMEVMSDHIHLFVEIPSTISVSSAFQALKGTSANLFFKRFPNWRRYFHSGHNKPHLWSPGKFFRSIGSVTAEVVEKYIRNSNDWNYDRRKK